MDKTARTGAERFLADDAGEKLAILDENLGVEDSDVLGVAVVLGVVVGTDCKLGDNIEETKPVVTDEIELRRYDEGEELLPGPQLLGLEDGWGWNLEGYMRVDAISCTVPVHEGRKKSNVIKWAFSMKISRRVILQTAVNVSCTIPMTGRLACGEIMFLWTIMFSTI